MADIKTWTGERLETFIYNENTNEHLHRYAIVLQLAAGRQVLDIACGEGYGASLMAAVATTVTGVDIDTTTIAHAKDKYKARNLTFLTGSADHIPCKENSFDIVVSFETIEHHDRHEEMMLEIKRVLKPEGVLIISSPDKLYYSDKPNFKNPFHVKELYRDEFEHLMNKHFANTNLLEQRSFFGSVIVADSKAQAGSEVAVYKGDYAAVEQNPMEAVYLIGVASDGALPALQTSILNGADILKKQFEDLRELITNTVVRDISKELKSSWSFRIGHFILAPVRFIQKLLHA